MEWFLYKYVFTRCGPIKIVSDQGMHSINEVVQYLLEEFMVVHKKFSPYHQQANGQEKSMNKILLITNIVDNSRTDWELKLHSALWAYHIAYKITLGMMPFNMVFGIDVILPLGFIISTLRVGE